jgi:hypothetical protein
MNTAITTTTTTIIITTTTKRRRRRIHVARMRRITQFHVARVLGVSRRFLPPEGKDIATAIYLALVLA